VSGAPALVAHRVSEWESDNRCIKAGWYALHRNGVIGLGPFPTQADCLAGIAYATDKPRSV